MRELSKLETEKVSGGCSCGCDMSNVTDMIGSIFSIGTGLVSSTLGMVTSLFSCSN
jgi:hypothetical protein